MLKYGGIEPVPFTCPPSRALAPPLEGYPPVVATQPYPETAVDPQVITWEYLLEHVAPVPIYEPEPEPEPVPTPPIDPIYIPTKTPQPPLSVFRELGGELSTDKS